MAGRDVHNEALKRFDAITEALQEERALCLQDRRFAFIAGAQWENEGWADMSENMIRVEVNKTARGLRKIEDDYRANRITVNYRPVGDSAQDTAELLDGMFRADAYRCKAQQALDNAFTEGTAGGMGAWRLINELEDEYDPDSDYQRIRTEQIADADQCVFFDLNAKLYDKSDARFAFVLTAMSVDAFLEEYGADRYSSWPDGLWRPFYDWYTPDIIRVAEYYEVEIVSEKRRTFTQGISGDTEVFWESEIEDDKVAEMIAQGWVEGEPKTRKRRRVAKYTFSGVEELKPKKYIAGSCIPIIPYYGRRVFIDSVERVQGHVRQAKDPQRIYNTQISKLTETAALAPREVLIVAPEQVAGLEDHWRDQNINRSPYLPLNPIYDAEGTIVQMGAIGKVEPPQLQPVQAALIQITANDIAELTSADDTASEAKSNISAEAMDIAATRTDARSMSYMDNMRQSVQRWGEIYLEMAKEVYVEQDRTVETMTEEGEQGEAVLLEAVTDEKGVFSVRHDLSKGKYKVISDVTEATTTRRDKTVKTCFAAAQMVGGFDPDMANAFLTTAVLNMDGEGIEDLQDYLRQKALLSGLVKPTDEEKQQLEAAAEQEQQPDPQQMALLAVAKKEDALGGKAIADTKLSEAKTQLTEAQIVETLAEARLKGAQTAKTGEETDAIGKDHDLRMGDQHIKRIQTGHQITAANDRTKAA